ncbi:MAG: pseudouridine synthase [Proteobacteria bacterium]|nr:pseudouridine synthase [Pseudomonadota bacterium]
MLNLIFQDDFLCVIDKPSGLPVHRDHFSPRAEPVCLQILRDQINTKVFPVHRLDRGTSGVLIFALNQESHRKLSIDWMNGGVQKVYHGVVRGKLPERIECHDALRDEGILRQATTVFDRVSYSEFPISNERFPSSRYTLAKIIPQQGRYHQIRRHANHLGYPLVGDTTHGDSDHNRIWSEHFGIKRLLLHCSEITLQHPETDKSITFRAGLPTDLTKKFSIPCQ